MRYHSENIGADDTDVLNGTDLDQLEGEGQLDIMAVSTQADSLLTVTPPGAEAPARSVEIPNETRAVRPGDDPVTSLYLPNGGHVIVNVDIVSAATIQFLAIWRKRGVDF